MSGIYVHIPFCLAKCGYCDFYSLVADDDLVGTYLSALKKEILHYSRLYQEQDFSTLYIGGGTPTRLTLTQLELLFEMLLSSFNFISDLELTVEANPGTIDKAKAKLLAQLGVNRISMGAQAFQDSILQRIGRVHSVVDIYESVELLQDAGITNINLDLIEGLPDQSLTDWEDSLAQALKLNPAHLSAYSLILEAGTPFYREYEQGKLEIPTEETEVAMFELTTKYLTRAGYEHYEISNYAVACKQAQHNLIYWHNDQYLGLGSGAHGYFNHIRYANVCDLTTYNALGHQNKSVISNQEHITPQRAMDDTMMLGLRLLAGVGEQDFIARFGISYLSEYEQEIDKLLRKGLIKFQDQRLSLTSLGVKLGNLVFSEFVR